MSVAGKIYRKVQGEWGWYDKETGVKEGVSAAIHPDTMKQELRHPVSGEKIDSMTKWNRTNEKLGLECVGNDLLSKKKRTVADKVTDEMILDRIEKAESILSDPAKKRAYDNEQLERLARHEKMFNGQHRY